MAAPENYLKKAAEDARDMASYFIDDIVEMIASDGEADEDMGNRSYGRADEYHHETHVDRSYTLIEAANLLDQLDQFEETDAGIWEGQSPREAISTQAAFTYGNAVYDAWQELIKDINSAIGDRVEQGLDRQAIKRIVRLVIDGKPIPPAGPKEWSPRS